MRTLDLFRTPVTGIDRDAKSSVRRIVVADALGDRGVILVGSVRDLCIHAVFYGAQGTLYASLYPARVRYTGLSTVYQLSGVYSSGLTPLILTALIGAAGGSPWVACGYLVATAIISVVATPALKPIPLHQL